MEKEIVNEEVYNENGDVIKPRVWAVDGKIAPNDKNKGLDGVTGLKIAKYMVYGTLISIASIRFYKDFRLGFTLNVVLK